MPTAWRTAAASANQRDSKGLYARARAGEIRRFTGMSSPYEPPQNPELHVKTGSQPLDVCVQQLIGHLEASGVSRG